jgi:hypothetical protein
MKDLYRNNNGPQVNQNQHNAHSVNQGQEKLMMSNNINSYREVLSEVRSPLPPQLPLNEFGIPNIGAYPQSVTNAQGVGSGLLHGGPKRNIQITNVKMNMQQFPPVPGVGVGSPQHQSDPSYTAHVLKARQSVGKRSHNRTINDNPT